MSSSSAPARIVAIVGPTASGKSDLAIQAARRFGGEIVSCDSVQVYRGLDIGSGKPSVEDRRRVRHHLIDILDLEEEMNASVFASQAAAAIEDIAGRGLLPIVTGGTGLYLTALLKGLFEHGGADPEMRARLEALAERYGPARLHRLLVNLDPAYAAKTQPSDQVRIIRALEVRFTLGRPFSDAQQERKPSFTGDALVIGLDPGRDELRHRVAARVAGMFEAGLFEETRRALARAVAGGFKPRALGAIGYREVAARLAQEGLKAHGEGEVVRDIVIATMQYAKRQMTYFRRQFAVEWFRSDREALERIELWIGRPGASN